MEGTAADLHFEVQAAPFEWLHFSLPEVVCSLHWRDLRLGLTNAQMELYGGWASGSAAFDFSANGPGADFRFSLTTAGTQLRPLMNALSSRTNQPDGRLTARLVITNANTEDWKKTGGFGSVELRDGLIWDIPIFGILTPALDALAPGLRLGRSRATAGTATFFITNGVVRSENLDIRSPPLRLEYRGTADLQGRINAHVEALVLRDMPLFGPFVSLAFWPVTKIFEYRVTGSLAEPKAEPLFIIPRIVLMPLHPLRTFKELLPEESHPNPTNAPPARP
jgi:hypothetical protein